MSSSPIPSTSENPIQSLECVNYRSGVQVDIPPSQPHPPLGHSMGRTWRLSFSAKVKIGLVIAVLGSASMMTGEIITEVMDCGSFKACRNTSGASSWGSYLFLLGLCVFVVDIVGMWCVCCRSSNERDG